MPDASRPSWITPAQLAVLGRLLTTCRALGLPHVATGGLAGNLHGSAWPLHDLDVDVPVAALPALAAHFADHVRFGPARYRDEEFDLDLLTLEIDGVTVDLSGAESIRLVTPDGTVVSAPTDVKVVEYRVVAAWSVPTLPLDRLVGYKRIIGRTADVQDLARLLPDARTTRADLSDR